jgi:hypothetical protein
LFTHSKSIDETFVNFTKQITQQKGKEKKWERTQVRAKGAITLSGSQSSKGTNYVSKPPPIAKNISQKESEKKPKSVVNLEKPSLAMMAHFKIDVACDLCKAIDILCL